MEAYNSGSIPRPSRKQRLGYVRQRVGRAETVLTDVLTDPGAQVRLRWWEERRLRDALLALQLGRALLREVDLG